MSLGITVNKGVLDGKVAQAALLIRSAFEQVETIKTWLANQPNDGTNDSLTQEPFNYDADEAYAMRSYFEQLDAFHTSNAALFDTGRKMTGLE